MSIASREARMELAETRYQKLRYNFRSEKWADLPAFLLDAAEQVLPPIHGDRPKYVEDDDFDLVVDSLDY